MEEVWVVVWSEEQGVEVECLQRRLWLRLRVSETVGRV